MIKYLGSKRTLIPSILDAVRAIPGARTVLDLFSGTSRVGHALKAAGYRVLANDHNAYAATIARCYIQSDLDDWKADAERLIAELSALPPRPGYFTQTFCIDSRFFRPENGARIDAIREAIARKSLPPELESILLVSLMEAADRVDSTTGVQMAYLKSWAPRAHNTLELRLPDLLPRAAAGKGRAYQRDALGAAPLAADVAYIDPPYNQHSYLGNYHIWESLVRWDKPDVYGIACKRADCRDRRSPFNSRPRFEDSFARLIRTVAARHLIVSFNNEGYLPRERLESILLSEGGTLRTHAHDFKRYVGAQIGIYNPQGRKVGRVSHLRNTEYLFILTRDEARATPTLRVGTALAAAG